MTSRFILFETGPCNRAARIFLISAAAILVLTGLAKFITITGEASILDRADPVFWFMTNRQLLVAVALLELAIAAAIFSKRFGGTHQLALVAWLGTAFLIYRAARSSTGDHGPCGCVGNLTEALGISASSADLGLKIMLIYLLAGSMVFLAMGFLGRGKPVQPGARALRKESLPTGVNSVHPEVVGNFQFQRR